MVLGKDKEDIEEETPKEKTGVNITINKKAEEKIEKPLDRAERLNKEKAELLEKEEKLMERKENLIAEEKVSGRADAGGVEPQVKEIDPVQYSKDALAGKVGDGKEE
tara:strand:+ start:221 stop:541 length:321 start_codon:yes stop_codon:yes gene_type:complete